MEYKTEGCSFTIKEVVTVRDQLRYSSGVAFASNTEKILTLWQAAQDLIENWECEVIPYPMKYDLDSETDPKAAEIIAWAAMRVWTHMNKLEEIPKN